MCLCHDTNDKSIKIIGVDSKLGIPNFLSKSDFVILLFQQQTKLTLDT